ncbi:MAG: prepilin-type N-terminal cleavage/methylation domain-containing protein [Propionivibrio sp.]
MVSKLPRALRRGFTLIELLVVMSIVGMLLAIAAPRYFSSIDRSKETMLRQTLSVTREALDKYYGDNGRYPDALDDLVTRKYLRSLPVDPLTGSSTTWVLVPPEAQDKGAVFDLKSGADGLAHDQTPYKEW